MNRILKYFTALIIVLVALSNSTDPPNGRTAAPGDGTCASCHQGNNFDGNIQIGGLPAEVESGETYTLSVTVSNTDGNAVRAGFQMVSLFNGEFTNAGTLMKDSDDEGVSVAGGRTYIEHRGAKNFQDSVAQWIFKWEAPIVDQDEEVVMFAAGNIANGSGSSGDAIKFTDMETLVKVAQDSLGVSIQATEIPCNGGTADLLAVVEGGTAPFSYIWSNTATTAENNSVPAGFYSVTVTDANDETASVEIIVEEPDLIVLDFQISATSATDAMDGSIVTTVTGGTTPYSYNWSNGATTKDIDGLTAGTYALTVTDANNCMDTIGLEVPGPECTFDINLTFNNVTCTGADDGEAFIDPENFVQPLDFSWSNGDNSFIAIAGLVPGAYSVTVTDGTGCTLVENFEIEEPDPLTVDVSAVFVDCSNPTVNSVNSEVTGGTGMYSYLWSNGETTPSLANVAEGDYSVEVQDANGCSVMSDTINVSFTDNEAPSITFEDSVSLFVNANGELDLTPLNLSEEDNCGIETTELLGDLSCDDLGPRSLTYEVTDVNGNVASVDIYVEAIIDTIPPSAMCVDDIVQQGCDTVFYDLPQFFDNCVVDSVELAEGLPSGSVFPKDSTKVTYNAYDAAGNFACCSFWVVTSNDLELSIDTVQDASTDLGGSISISVTGGSGNYTYEWTLNDTLVVSNFEDVTNLEPGSYIVKVTDEAGCNVVSDAILIELGSSTVDWQISNVEIFPNPVSSRLNITTESEVISVRVVNLNGRLITAPYQKKVSNNIELDVSSLISGIYFIQLEFAEGMKTERFTKI